MTRHRQFECGLSMILTYWKAQLKPVVFCQRAVIGKRKLFVAYYGHGYLKNVLCITLTKEDLLYEGVPANTSVDDFLIKYCKGVPTDTACFSSSFIDDQGNSCEQEKVVFLMRFTYIDFSKPIPMLLNDLKMTWQLSNVADDVTDKCGSCMLKAILGDECTSSCTSCERLVHCEPDFSCAVKISGRFYCGPCSAIQALGLQQVSQYPAPLVNDSLIPDQVKWGNIVGLGGGPYRYKHSNLYELYYLSPKTGKVLGNNHNSSTSKPYFLAVKAAQDRQTKLVWHFGQSVLLPEVDKEAIIFFLYTVQPMETDGEHVMWALAVENNPEAQLHTFKLIDNRLLAADVQLPEMPAHIAKLKPCNALEFLKNFHVVKEQDKEQEKPNNKRATRSSKKPAATLEPEQNFVLETDRDYVGEVKVEDTDAKKVYNKKKRQRYSEKKKDESARKIAAEERALALVSATEVFCMNGHGMSIGKIGARTLKVRTCGVCRGDMKGPVSI